MRVPLKLQTHVLHMIDLYEELCVTHGSECVLHMASFIEDRLQKDIERVQESM